MLPRPKKWPLIPNNQVGASVNSIRKRQIWPRINASLTVLRIGAKTALGLQSLGAIAMSLDGKKPLSHFYSSVCFGNKGFRNIRTALLGSLLLISLQTAFAAPDPTRVQVVYRVNGPDNNNNGVSDSLELAQYYAQKRGVPQSNLLGLNTSTGTAYASNYYSAGQYTTFYNEMVAPIQSALNSRGPTNIDVILLAGELPWGVYDGSGNGHSTDSALMGIYVLGSPSSGTIFKGSNPYFDPAPGFDPSPGHFSHSTFQYSGTPMYLVTRLGSDSSLRGMDQVDQSVYADRFLYPQPGYYYGNAYVNSLAGQPNGQPYTDAFLSAQGPVQIGLYDNSTDADMNIAYAEHYILASGLPLKWQNSPNGLVIGNAGAMFSDGTSALSAPRALFYGGWYNYYYNNVYQWLPGSVAIELASSSNFAVGALDHGASGALYSVAEPLLNGSQRPHILYYYLLAGYDFAEASMLAAPYIGWVGVNEGDPLYAPLQPKTAALDTQAPVLKAGYPILKVDPASGAAVLYMQVDDYQQPEVVSARIDYGPDTNYGNFATSAYFSRTPQVSLPWVLNQVYHYRITLTDPAGNTTVSADLVHNPPNAGLIGYWNFDEGSGSIAHDTSGNNYGYDATISGATWIAGKINSALSFNGSTNYVVTPNIVLGNTFSISAWVNPTAIPQGSFWRIAETRYTGGLYLGTDASGTKYKFIVNNGTGSTGSCGATFGCAQGGTITSGWHLVTATFDGTTATLYVDNSMVATETFTAPGNTTYPLYIGRYYGANGYGWNGGIDEVRLYNRALTSTEVSAIYNNNGGPPDTTPPSTPTNVSATAVSSSQINVSWTASTDNVGVAGYKVFRNGSLVKTTTAVSYSDTGLAASTMYSYTVAAFDAAGNVSPQSTAVSATTLTPDTTPPTVSITAPAGGATVSNTITVSANASDNVAVADVQFQLDGVNLGPDLTAAPYSISWDTTTVGNGSHTLTAKARDTSQNSTTSAPVMVTVSNTIVSPPTNGLIGYWNFDENSGTVAHDTSGSGYNGTVSGATWTAGYIHSALSFNGSTNYVVTPNIALGQTFSVSAWVNPAVTTQTAYGRIAETQYNGGLYLGTDASGTKYKFIVNTGTGSTGSCGAAYGCAQGGTVTSGWHSVVATFDGATAKLYVDNTLVATETFTAPGNTTYPLYISHYYSGNGYGWNGIIDEVRLYNRALTSTEVSAIYNSH